LIVPAYGATPHGASASVGYATAVAAWLAVVWLAGAVLGGAELALGVEPEQAVKTIAAVPRKASTDHPLLRDILLLLKRLRAGCVAFDPDRSVRSALNRPTGRGSRVPRSLARDGAHVAVR
jgi:hypothetical protein